MLKIGYWLTYTSIIKKGKRKMAQTKPEYERLDEYKELAAKIIDRYPDRFYGIELDRIQAYMITNKESKEDSQKLFEVHAVKMPILLDSKCSHYVVVYSNDWLSMEEAHKLLLIAQTLCAIPLDENGQMVMEKVNTFNMKDFSPMLRTFGTDYLIRDNVPNLLQEEVAWRD